MRELNTVPVCHLVTDEHCEHGLLAVGDTAEGGLPFRADRCGRERGDETSQVRLLPSTNEREHRSSR